MRHYVPLMGGMGSRIALGLAVVVAALGLTTTAANAGANITASETCCTFDPGPFTQGLGEIATFDNTKSTAPHDVVATGKGPDGQPLFLMSGAILGGDTAPVNGTQYLKAGTYPFYCSIHGAAMSGELTVDGGSGTAVARPSVKVSFIGQKLNQVRRVGVKVKLKAVTASRNVTVTASKGKVKLGSTKVPSLSAGQNKTVTISLTKSGRKALGKGKVAQISLKATVPFGNPASASRRVR